MNPAERAKQLTAAHWGYVGKTLEVHGIQPEELEIIRHHYLTSGQHFYLHAVEDCENNMFNMFVDEVAMEAELDRSCGDPSQDMIHRNQTLRKFQLCPSCARTSCAKGEYPATSDGGCEGYIKAERKASLCHSCHAVICSKDFISACEESGTCAHFVSALRERMLDAASPCDTCATFPCDDLGGKAVKCSNWKEKAATAKQDTPKPDEPALAHTDPTTNCKDCGKSGCAGCGTATTIDSGCAGFVPKEETPFREQMDFNLPTYAVACNLREILEKFKEEVEEYEDATPDSMAQLIEAWDCVQVAQTYREHGGCSHDVEVGSIMVDLKGWHEMGKPVMLAKRAMLIKNAARAMYSDKDNAAILATL